jgi:hypothetical protein
VSVEGKRKERIERKPGSRKHDRVLSSKKKRKISYDKDGKPLTNTARLNVSTEKKKPKRERLDNFSKLEVSVDKDNKATLKRTGSNFERTESAKLGPKKASDTIVKRQLKTENKIATDKKYDMTKQKTEPFTFKKSEFTKTKPQQAIQNVSTYTLSKQQTPQQTDTLSYLRKQPQGASQPQQQIHKGSYTRPALQQIRQSPYTGSKPKEYTKQLIYEKDSQQTTYGQVHPKYDYSKYNKSYTDQKLKGNTEVEEKYKQQKPSYVKKFDFTDKVEKPKGMNKQQTAYDLQKLGKKAQIGKPGQYSILEKKIDDRPENIGRLEVSVEKKKKEKVERKPGSRTHERLCSSKKRKLSLDKDGKPLKNTSRLNVSTEKKKEKREKLDNIGRLEISAEKKKKERVERKPGSRKHDRIHSSKKKRKISYDKDGKPLTNTARLNVSTEKKKPKKERLDNLSKLEISVEGKKKERIERKPGSRKHDRIHSSKKKRKISYDKDGKPLTNIARLNVSTEKKKEKRERLDNHSQLEVSVEGKRKERIERKPGSRKHDRVLSSKKKRKISYDSEGKPLTNTSRLKVGFENNKLKYMEKDEYGHNKNMDRFDSFEKRKSDYAFKKYPTATKQFGQKQGVQEISSYSYYAQNQTPKDKSSLKDQPYQYNTYQKPQNQKFSSTQNKRQITTTGKIQTKDTTRQSYNYPVSTKKDIGSYQKSKQEGIKLDYQQYSTVSSSQFNTAETNAGSKYGRTKRIESSDKFLYKSCRKRAWPQNPGL